VKIFESGRHLRIELAKTTRNFARHFGRIQRSIYMSRPTRVCQNVEQ